MLSHTSEKRYLLGYTITLDRNRKQTFVESLADAHKFSDFRFATPAIWDQVTNCEVQVDPMLGFIFHMHDGSFVRKLKSYILSLEHDEYIYKTMINEYISP